MKVTKLKLFYILSVVNVILYIFLGTRNYNLMDPNAMTSFYFTTTPLFITCILSVIIGTKLVVSKHKEPLTIGSTCLIIILIADYILTLKSIISFLLLVNFIYGILPF